jgi:YVTN family beta-propeller protein
VLPGFAERTLELLNGTVVAGNALPLNAYEPEWIAFDPARGTVYSLSAGGLSTPSLQVVNATTDRVVAGIAIGAPPYETALDSAAGLVLVASSGSQTVEVINTTTYRAVANFDVQNYTVALAVDPANGLAYVVNEGPSGAGNVTVLNLTTDAIAAWIAVGGTPSSIAYDPANQELYVANSADNNVSVINGTTNTVVANVPVGTDPGQLAIDAANDSIYVLSGYPSNNISVLSGSNNTAVGAVSLGAGDYGGSLAFDPVSSHLYVTLPFNNEVGVVSTVNNSLFATVQAGSQPTAIAVDGPLGAAAVLNLYSSNVTLISTTTNLVTGSIAVASDPDAVAVDTTNGTMYIPDTGADAVQVVNGSSLSVAANISVGLAPHGIAYDPANGEVYVTESDAGTTTVVNGSSYRVIATVPAGSGATHATVATNESRVFITNPSAGTVTAINSSTNTVAGTTDLGGSPGSTIWDAANGDLYVVDAATSAVSAINGSSGRVVANISVTGDPSGLALDPSNGEIYVDSDSNGRVTVIDGVTNRFATNVSLGNGGYPQGILYDPGTGYVVVLTVIPNDLVLISGSTNSVVKTVPVGSSSVSPNDMAVDPATGTIFVSEVGRANNGTVQEVNTTSGQVVANVTVGEFPSTINFDPLENVAFVLNPGSNNVSVIGLSNFSVAATYPVGAGVWGAAVDSATGAAFLGNSAQGTLSIVGPAPPYDVNFTENGLRTGTNWSVDLDGTTLATTSAVLTFQSANGTYPFSVAPAPGYAPTPNAGQVLVNGSSVNVSITFDPTFVTTFNESGLPAGTSWAVSLNGSTNRTTVSTLTFAEPNGTYPFAVANVPGWRSDSYSGLVNVTGSGAQVQLTWTQTEYQANFTSVGLPSGRSWAVILNETSYRSSSVTIGFELPNGTYNYSVAGAPGFAPLPASGSFSINGASVNRSVNFTEGFAVEFVETGLPTSTNWAVTLNGSLNFSTAGTVGFEATNGTLGYALSNVPGWRADAYFGYVTVAGTNTTVDVTWTRTVYAVGFTELGLPAGTSWSVEVGGNVSRTTSSATLVSEPNGTFAFSVGNVPGWRASEYGGTVNVTGGPIGITIFWTANVFAVTFGETGLPTGDQWSISLNGSSPTFSTTSSITLEAENGSVPYTVGNVPGWRADAYVGVVPVDDGPAGLTVTWTAVTYTVEVAEVGLPAGTSWGITVGGTLNRSIGTSIEFSAANGTATFNASNVPGWRANSYNFSVAVNGATAATTVRWARATYVLTITETGLPTGVTWTALVNGTAFSSLGSTVSVTGLPNGTYALSISAPGSVALGAPTAVTIAGPPNPLSISFGPSPHTQAGSVLPYLAVAALAGVVVVLVAAWLVLRRRRGRAPAGGTADSTEPPSSEPGTPPASESE